MKSRFGLIPSLVTLALAATASIAGAQKSYAVGVSAGAGIPTGKFNDAYSTGYTAAVFIALGVPDLPIGVRFDGVYNQFAGRTVLVTGGDVEIEIPDLRLIGAVGNLIYTFPGTTAKPYIVTGAGFYNSKNDAPGAKSRNDLGFSAGLGATFGLGGLAAVIEARYHGIAREAEAGGGIHFVPVTLGLVF
jgi:hypothetical protein